jgi:site-specific DNA-methyltransferase (adenine-specific)
VNLIGDFQLNRVHQGDCLDLGHRLPADCIDIIITSPPYWGQRVSNGVGAKDDPRNYISSLTE